MDDHRPAHDHLNLASYSGASNLGMRRYVRHDPERCRYTRQFVIIFAALCAISVPYVAYSGAFHRFGDEGTHERTRQATNEPGARVQKPEERANEPGMLRTNPRVQLVAPRGLDAAWLLGFRRATAASDACRLVAMNPSLALVSNEPDGRLTGGSI